MDIKELFETMISDPNIEVKEFARRAQEIEILWQRDKISEAEYKELCADLLELKYINKEMLSLDVQKKLDTFVTYLKNLKFFASLM